MLTLGEIRPHAAPLVRGGVAVDSDEVVVAVNAAIAALLQDAYAKGEFSEWTLPVENGVVLLPPEVEVAEVFASPVRAQTRPQWYRFVRATCPCAYVIDCSTRSVIAEDLGDGHVTMTAPTCDTLLTAWAERTGDATAPRELAGLVANVQAVNDCNEPVFSHDENDRAVPGIRLTIGDNRLTYSKYHGREVRVRRITAVEKPVTRWPVVIAAYEPPLGTNPGWVTPLVRMMPWETQVSRRAYRLSDASLTTVTLLGRARWRSAQFDHERLLVGDLTAIRHMLQAQDAELRVAPSLEGAAYHQQRAQASLATSWSRHRGPSGEPFPVSFPNPAVGLGFGDIHMP